MQPDQTKLFSLFPGSAGGRALAERRGAGYLADLGRTGGLSTRDRYGRDRFAELGRASGAARRLRRDSLPRTVQRLDGTAARVIPWQPHRESSEYSPRRRRPVFVLVELGAGDGDE